MISPSPDGSGGTSPGGVCSASPTDINSQVDNILTRLEKVEQILSELLGVDITTIQLSDLAPTQDLGTFLTGNLGGGILSQLVTQLGKVNGWGKSAGFDFMDTQTNGGSWDFIAVSGAGTANSFSGYSSSSTYTYKTTAVKYTSGQDLVPLENLIGGFYYECRLIPISNSNPTRVAAGLSGNNSASSPAGDGGPIWNSGVDNNKDDPVGCYIIFQYSTFRGDTTWKMASRNHAGAYDPYEQVTFDTGVPVIVNHAYDLIMRCEPGANSIQWTIKNQTLGTTASGDYPVPSLWEETTAYSGTAVFPYLAGAGNWVTDPLHASGWLLHHIWCQSLKLERV